MAQLQATFQYGLNITAGTAAQSRSYAYDESQYIQTDPIQLTIGPGTGGASAFGVAGAGIDYVVCFTNKQLKSITVARLGTTTLATTGDNISLYLSSQYAQVFGTATGPSYLNTAVGTGTLYSTSTLLGTAANTVTLLAIQSWGSGQSGMAGTGSYAGGTAAPSVQVTQLSNGTFAVVVSNAAGTNTQTGYVFPIGPNGGLSLGPGDILAVSKSATDTLAAYAIELEFAFSPGGYVTR